MKIRYNYVSNSSSSSFILANEPSISQLNDADFNEMLQDLYPEYDSVIREHRLSVIRNMESDWVFPFIVFDLDKERELAGEVLDHLDEWMANKAIIKNGELFKTKTSVGLQWRNVCSYVANQAEKEYRKAGVNVQVDLSGDLDDIKSESNVVSIWTKTGKGKYKYQKKPLKKKYLNLLEKSWKSIGICSNLDVLLNSKSRFAIHFSENEINCIKGMCDDSKGVWKTEDYSYSRFCEIMAKWLVEHKKVPEKFTYRNFLRATLTFNMHEG